MLAARQNTTASLVVVVGIPGKLFVVAEMTEVACAVDVGIRLRGTVDFEFSTRERLRKKK